MHKVHFFAGSGYIARQSQAPCTIGGQYKAEYHGDSVHTYRTPYSKRDNILHHPYPCSSSLDHKLHTLLDSAQLGLATMKLKRAAFAVVLACFLVCCQVSTMASSVPRHIQMLQERQNAAAISPTDPGSTGPAKRPKKKTDLDAEAKMSDDTKKDAKDATAKPGAGTAGKPVKPATGKAGAAGATGPVIDFMLSNYWNNTQYLAQTNPKIPFVQNGDFKEGGQNSTEKQPTIVTVEVKERREYQTMDGLGAGITDATAIVLQALKEKHPDAYDELLNLCFNESPEWIAKGGAGMNMVRIPIGASDFGFVEYTYDDTVDGSPDPSLKQFNIDKSPKRWQTLQDILKINPDLQVVAAPWSQPAWMKGNLQGSLHGGSVLEKYESVYGDYLIRFINELKRSKGITVNMLSLQNEPLYDGGQYPCTKMEADQQARIGLAVRKKLDAADLKRVGLLTYDHNWDNQDYGIQVFDKAAEAFVGIAWHCYAGQPDGQDRFNDAYPGKTVYFTECTRTTQQGDEPWPNVKKQFNALVSGSVSHGSQTVILWNLALSVDGDGFTTPSLPQTCTNCLAPCLVLQSATGELEGLNATAIKALQQSAQQKGTHASKEESPPEGQSNAAINSRDITSQPFVPPKQDSTGRGAYGGLDVSKIALSKDVNSGAENEGKVIPPDRDTYYRTSDFVTLAHLGTAIRAVKGTRGAKRIGVITSEDDYKGPRLKAQLFRNEQGDVSALQTTGVREGDV